MRWLCAMKIEDYIEETLDSLLNDEIDISNLCYTFSEDSGYVAFLIEFANFTGKGTNWYKICKGTAVYFRGDSKDQNKEIQSGRAEIHGQMMIFTSDTEPYSYSHIQRILVNERPSSISGAVYPKYFERSILNLMEYEKFILKSAKFDKHKEVLAIARVPLSGAGRSKGIALLRYIPKRDNNGNIILGEYGTPISDKRYDCTILPYSIVSNPYRPYNGKTNPEDTLEIWQELDIHLEDFKDNLSDIENLLIETYRDTRYIKVLKNEIKISSIPKAVTLIKGRYTSGGLRGRCDAYVTLVSSPDNPVDPEEFIRQLEMERSTTTPDNENKKTTTDNEDTKQSTLKPSLFSDSLIEKVDKTVRNNFITLLLGPAGNGKTQLSMNIPTLINSGVFSDWATMINHNISDLSECKVKIDEMIEKAHNNPDKLYFIIFNDGIKSIYFEQMLGKVYDIGNSDYRHEHNIPDNIRVIITGNDVTDGFDTVIYNNLSQSNLSRFAVVRCNLDINSNKVVDAFTNKYTLDKETSQSLLDIVQRINNKLIKYKSEFGTINAAVYCITLRHLIEADKLSTTLERLDEIAQSIIDNTAFRHEKSICELCRDEASELLKAIEIINVTHGED